MTAPKHPHFSRFLPGQRKGEGSSAATAPTAGATPAANRPG